MDAPLNQTSGRAQTGTANRMAEAANAALAFFLVVLFLVAVVGFVVWYVVQSVEDDIALTMILCVVGLVGISVMFLTGGVLIYFVRRMGGALTEQQSSNHQALAQAFVQLVAEQRRTNEINQQLLTRALQLPAPVPTTAHALASANTQQQLPTPIVVNERRRRPWVYPVMRDGKALYARGDLIEAFVHWGFDPDLQDSQGDFRDYMRDVRGVSMANEQPTLIRAALEHEGAILSNNDWATDEKGVWQIVERMRERGVQP